MKFIITTTYDRVDDEWLEWYLNRMENEEVLPGCREIIKSLRKNLTASFVSHDANSDVVATTNYRIKK